jgi:Fe(3+) dicitrate transport protein
MRRIINESAQMRIISFVTLVIMYIGSWAQGSISGNVLQEDSVGIPASSVYLLNTKLGAATNSKGYFKIENIPAGQYTLVVSSVGYQKSRQVIDIQSSKTANVIIILPELVTDLQPLVVNSGSITGGRLGMKDMPGSAYYVSPRELEKFNHTDINRTLRNIPGVNIQEEEGFGLRPSIGLRGTSVDRNSKITLMEDGILMAPAPYSAPAAYYFPTAGRMQAIEVVKGSSQIKYGPFTTGGAINLISSAIPNELTAKVRISGGSFGMHTAHVNVGASNKNFGYLVETFQYGAEGFKELPNGANTGFDKQDYMVKLRANTNPDAKVYQSVTLKLLSVNEISNETYLGISDADFLINPIQRYAASQVDKITTNQRSVSLSHFARITKNIELNTVGYYSQFGRNWYKLNNMRDTNTAGSSVQLNAIVDNPENYPHLFAMMRGETDSHNGAFNVRANNRKYYSQGVQSTLGVKYLTGLVAHKIDFGVRLHYDNMDRFQWDDRYRMTNGVLLQTTTGTPGTESNRIEDAFAFASHLQYTVNYKKLTTSTGVRMERITMNGWNFGRNNVDRDFTDTNLVGTTNSVMAFMPGVSVDYKVNKQIQLFGGAHKGFAPSGNRVDTRPEESMNFEAGVKFNNHDYMAFNVCGFYTNYSNLLGVDLAASGGGGTTDLFNLGSAQVVGIESHVVYDPLAQQNLNLSLPITLSYTYTNAIFTSDFNNNGYGDWGVVQNGDQVPYIAPHQLSLNTSLEYKNWAIHLSSRFMDAMRTESGSGELVPELSTDSYFILDANVNYALNKHVSCFGGVNNFTNQSYIVARRPYGVRPGMPRMVQIGIKATF